jgi:AcrR family transcriptional regulator
MYAHDMPAVAPSERSRRTRSVLIDAAIERMAASGPAVDLAAIAADAGLTKGAMYHHFGSVDGLVEEVYKEAIRRHAELVTEASSVGTGRERLLGLVDKSARLYGSGTPFYRLLLRLHVEAGVMRPHLAPIARKVQRRQRTYMTELIVAGQSDGSIRTDIDPRAVGEMVNATLQGLLVQQLEPARVQRRAALDFGELIEVLL